MYDHLMEQGVPLNDPEEYSKEMIAALSLEDVNPELIQIILAAINREEYDKDDIEDIKRSMTALSINLIAHRKKMMKGKSSDKKQVKESTFSKKNLLREIVIPEAKKKYKVKPKVLGHPSNKTLSNQMKDTTPNVAFKKEIPVWSMDQKMRNARESQKKKNEVLEYLLSLIHI